MHKTDRSRISIVIPTFNNERTIIHCLDALARQTFPMDAMEVLVMVDGSTDQTMSRLAAYQAPYRLKFAAYPNQGPGPMRNLGILQSTYDWVLIINDDLLADPQLVARHAAWHESHPEKEYALLGFVEEHHGNDRDFPISRLDKSFNLLRGRRELEWKHFYTTNISVKKQFLIDSNQWFSNAFPHPAYEDIEMGYRLGQHGMKLFFDGEARGVHHHPMTYEQYARRAYQSGVCLAVFYKLHPELREYLVERGLISRRGRELNRLKCLMADLLLNSWNVRLFESLAKRLGRIRWTVFSEFLFSRLFGFYQRRGVRQGLGGSLAHSGGSGIGSHA